MAGLIAGFGIFQKLPEHVGKSGYGAGGEAIGLTGKRRKGVISSENITRAVDEIEVVSGF
jgi:hypothetical protein